MDGSTDGIEVNADVVKSWIEAFKLVRHVPHSVLAKHGIGTLSPNGDYGFGDDEYFPLGSTLAASAEFEAILGAKKMFEVGTHVARNAIPPEGAGDLRSAMQLLDIGYHMNHRCNGKPMFDPSTGEMVQGIGNYRCIAADDERILMEVDAPYQCDFDQGIMLTWAKRFEPKARVKHLEPWKCRKSGHDLCTYEIRWR